MKTHKVTRDGKVLFSGTENECFVYILKHQSQSVDWATKYEGWKIEKSHSEVDEISPEDIQAGAERYDRLINEG